MTPIKIIICGLYGRMGQAVLASAKASDQIEISAGVDKFPRGGEEFPVFTDFSSCTADCDVIVDFSRPEALPDMLKFALAHHCGLVIATTGYSEEQKTAIAEASREVPVFQSFNMSLGLNLLSTFVRKAAEFLGEDFDIEIIEKHHNLKVDSPSGTALMLAEAANTAFDGKKEYIYGRHGGDTKRKSSEIGIHAIRGGTIVGEHDVMFMGYNECVTLSHSAFSREVFARGALKAALFLSDKENGRYDMQDVIQSQYAVHNTYERRAQALLSFESLGDVAEVFTVLAEAGVNIDLINESCGRPDTLSLAVSIADADLPTAESALRAKGIPYAAHPELSKVVAEGYGMKLERGVAARLMRLLSGSGIRVLLISTSETEISLLVPAKDGPEAMRLIREHFHV